MALWSTNLIHTAVPNSWFVDRNWSSEGVKRNEDCGKTGSSNEGICRSVRFIVYKKKKKIETVEKAGRNMNGRKQELINEEHTTI